MGPLRANAFAVHTFGDFLFFPPPFSRSPNRTIPPQAHQP